MRARIDVSEIEAQTKIRAKYLRALENEEWGLLPGPTFVKSFLRTYAQALGSTARRWSRNTACTTSAQRGDARADRLAARARTRRRGRPAPSGPSRGYTIAVGAIGRADRRADRAAAGDGGGRPATTHRRPHSHERAHEAHRRATRATAAPPTRQRRTPAVARAVAEADGARLRVPDRRQRPQADPGARTAGRRKRPRPTTPSTSQSPSATAR